MDSNYRSVRLTIRGYQNCPNVFVRQILDKSGKIVISFPSLHKFAQVSFRSPEVYEFLVFECHPILFSDDI